MRDLYADTMTEFLEGLARAPSIIAKATSYTDYIAHRIQQAFEGSDPEGIVDAVGAVKHDLHPTQGYALSTNKVIEVTDRNGNAYRITVEDLREVR